VVVVVVEVVLVVVVVVVVEAVDVVELVVVDVVAVDGKNVTRSEFGFGGRGGLVGLLFEVLHFQSCRSVSSIALLTSGKYCLLFSQFGGAPGGLGGIMTTCDDC